MPVGESILVSPVISTPVAPIIEDHVAASSPAQPISAASAEQAATGQTCLSPPVRPVMPESSHIDGFVSSGAGALSFPTSSELRGYIDDY